ncbi:MAG TPA: hypothetical protein VHC86_08015 [Opitutaceae bacterium]|nr:hypothetical protein [Opitutaceae bacterium]
MSLNPYEQRVFDYLRAQPDEGRFWQEKIRKAALAAADQSGLTTRLERDLWGYFEERSQVLPAWREAARREGLRRVSMRNLAELLVRLWTEPRPKRRREEGAVPPEF